MAKWGFFLAAIFGSLLAFGLLSGLEHEVIQRNPTDAASIGLERRPLAALSAAWAFFVAGWLFAIRTREQLAANREFLDHI